MHMNPLPPFFIKSISHIFSVHFSVVLGDGSPSTLWDNKSWRRIYPRLKEPPYVNADVIAAVTPGVKLIIILRDPVERLSMVAFILH